MMMKIDDEDEKDDLDDDDEDWWWKGGTGVTGGPAMMTNQSAPCPPKIIFFLGFRYDFTKMCGGASTKLISGQTTTFLAQEWLKLVGKG